MNDKQFNRYFFIDTNPSQSKSLVTTPQLDQEEIRDYESDHIDEELEHRLYSMIDHHHPDEPPADPPGIGVETNQPFEYQQSRPFIVDPVPSSEPGGVGVGGIGSGGDRQTNSNAATLNTNNKRGKKGQSNSPSSSSSKKFKPSTSSSTSTNPITSSKTSSTSTSTSSSNSSPSTSKSTEDPKQQPAVIYLSDSDEDATGDDELKVLSEKRDLWHIDYKDFLIAHPIHGKFYRPRIWCTRCRKEGNHPVKLCHLPKYKVCYICGATGHLGQHCQNQHCKRCMDFHTTSSCTLNLRDFKCRICGKYGHLDDGCPNHWRKFYNITNPQEDPNLTSSKIKKNTKKQCSFCGRHQHFAFECDRLNPYRSIQVSSPYDTNTSFGGKFIPSRSGPTPKTPQQYHHQVAKPNMTPNSRKIYGRKPPASRYFTSDSVYRQVNEANTSGHQPSDDVTFLQPAPPPPLPSAPAPSSTSYRQSPKKSPKKKPKNKKKKNFANQPQARSNDFDFIKGGSIRAGRVKKQKPKKKKQKKTSMNFQHELHRESFHNRPPLYTTLKRLT